MTYVILWISFVFSISHILALHSTKIRISCARSYVRLYIAVRIRGHVAFDVNDVYVDDIY